jgi:uncharacterized protein
VSQQTSRSDARAAVVLALLGTAMGFSLSRIGFGSWDEVHSMFTFSSLRLTLAFLTGVVVLIPAWKLIHRLTGATWSPRNIHPGTFIGGALFGLGWALTGACPAIALVQLGEGQLAAILTLVGIFLGNLLYSVVHDRFFRWSTQSCADV